MLFLGKESHSSSEVVVFFFLFMHLCSQAGKGLQQTPPGTWHYHWHTDPLRAAEKISC